MSKSQQIPIEKMPGRPEGPVEGSLPDGTTWLFRMVRIACNVAMPKGTEHNRLPELMGSWFGPDAGVPGTAFKVVIRKTGEAWSVEPMEVPRATIVQPIVEQAPAPNVIDIVQEPAPGE